MATTPRLTSPDRVVFPGAGITKGEVANYYRAVARWLLPDLVHRPLSLVRCPDGIAGSCFFQKHHADSLGAHVRAIRLREVQGDDEVPRAIAVQVGAGPADVPQVAEGARGIEFPLLLLPRQRRLVRGRQAARPHRGQRRPVQALQLVLADTQHVGAPVDGQELVLLLGAEVERLPFWAGEQRPGRSQEQGEEGAAQGSGHGRTQAG